MAADKQEEQLVCQKHTHNQHVQINDTSVACSNHMAQHIMRIFTIQNLDDYIFNIQAGPQQPMREAPQSKHTAVDRNLKSPLLFSLKRKKTRADHVSPLIQTHLSCCFCFFTMPSVATASCCNMLLSILFTSPSTTVLKGGSCGSPASVCRAANSDVHCLFRMYSC